MSRRGFYFELSSILELVLIEHIRPKNTFSEYKSLFYVFIVNSRTGDTLNKLQRLIIHWALALYK